MPGFKFKPGYHIDCIIFANTAGWLSDVRTANKYLNRMHYFEKKYITGTNRFDILLLFICLLTNYIEYGWMQVYGWMGGVTHMKCRKHILKYPNSVCGSHLKLSQIVNLIFPFLYCPLLFHLTINDIWFQFQISKNWL